MREVAKRSFDGGRDKSYCDRRLPRVILNKVKNPCGKDNPFPYNVSFKTHSSYIPMANIVNSSNYCK